MRDLSIRGAGNLLGSSQSGFIDSVGFELYSQLLEEAIAKKNGTDKKREKGNIHKSQVKSQKTYESHSFISHSISAYYRITMQKVLN